MTESKEVVRRRLSVTIARGYPVTSEYVYALLGEWTEENVYLVLNYYRSVRRFPPLEEIRKAFGKGLGRKTNGD